MMSQKGRCCVAKIWAENGVKQAGPGLGDEAVQ